ncbi:alpha-L-arabinofuranosidase C-terminal domain-containing protein [Mucilaginibacter paludis]|uniref:non-reducing end alpha-L-arabinofuranosidase n=1 Tax=Mucilaginibacter paludis DSM 18603 TaxID=714943 RepID=H1YCQ1_9SPHI|nr:alpha-L-arabinofuranosidase C-terminal domain-containing protein [Mucilaginibacter paludis]EHQ24238.1 alpha-L-arabinofuranosidase domain protein [Mucilaginibacter paludis DSM 18603]
MRKITRIFFVCVVLSNALFGQDIKNITVLVDKPTAKVSPNMWGIFFEDINFAADGGLYAELVKNRSFEFLSPLMGWKEVKHDGGSGSTLIINRGEANSNNPRFARITVKSASGSYGLENEGFRGMGIEGGKQYNFSVFARQNSGATKIKIQLLGTDNKILGEAALQNFTDQWNKYSVSFNSTATDAKAHLAVLFEGEGVLDVDMISLFPKDTWKGRPNGLRADLAQKLADLKPGFIRFPGGCIVEGRDLANRYQWKKTVGKVEDRELIINRWNTEFSHRSAPDYFQSYGLGFFEYFQLAEDIGAAPLPILNCGMACQYNTAEVAPLDQIDPFIQDALDLVEFANGPVTSKWGKLRAEMGHPAPFNLKMMGVGNEQWDVQYLDRYKLFAKALNAKYPDIKLITSSGPSPSGAQFDYLQKELRVQKANFLDEHYYQSPDWFMQNASRYDGYDRNSSKIFAGEYAAHIKEPKTAKDAETMNAWISALAEAAFMTGLERNADVVQMASYAPLLAHVEAWQWRPDLIWFDNLRSVATPNYYVQKLFANNKGTDVVPALMDGKILAGKDSLYSSAVIDKTNRQLIVKIVNTSSKPMPVKLSLQNGPAYGKATWTELSSANDLDINTLNDPQRVYPAETALASADLGKSPLKLKPKSVNVIKVSYK